MSGVEIQFWKDVIEKYLEPLYSDKKKEKKQADDLITLRNQMVFSFFMLNAIFVLVVFMLQQQKQLIFIRWPLDPDINVTYSNENVIRFPHYFYLLTISQVLLNLGQAHCHGIKSVLAA